MIVHWTCPKRFDRQRFELGYISSDLSRNKTHLVKMILKVNQHMSWIQLICKIVFSHFLFLLFVGKNYVEISLIISYLFPSLIFTIEFLFVTKSFCSFSASKLLQDPFFFIILIIRS